MPSSTKRWSTFSFLLTSSAVLALLLGGPVFQPAEAASKVLASKALSQLAVKGRAPKTGYLRSQFSDGWGRFNGCDTRNIILNRDLGQVTYKDGCQVATGVLNDPYTGRVINFVRGVGTSSAVQIDHVVALSDAWQKGAQQISAASRYALYNLSLIHI
jgi:hypothetical protein